MKLTYAVELIHNLKEIWVSFEFLEAAQARLPPEVLKALEEKFMGSLTQVRHRDERDQML